MRPTAIGLYVDRLVRRGAQRLLGRCNGPAADKLVPMGFLGPIAESLLALTEGLGQGQRQKSRLSDDLITLIVSIHTSFNRHRQVRLDPKRNERRSHNYRPRARIASQRPMIGDGALACLPRHHL